MSPNFPRSRLRRRTFLAAAAGGLAASLAGCSDARADESSRGEPRSFALENRRENAHRFSVVLTRTADGTTVVDGTYGLLAGHGTVFREVLVPGATHRLAVAMDDLAPLTREWTVPSCPDGEGTEAVDVAGAFVVDTDGMGFAETDCDGARDGDDLTVVPPGEIAVEAGAD